VTIARGRWIAGPIDIAALLYVLLACVWLGLASPGGALTTLVGEIVFLPLGLVVGAVAWGNARRADDVRTRLAWRLVALGVVSLWGTGAVYALFDPSLSGELKWWVSLLYFPLVAAGLLAFPRAPLRRSDRARYGLDLALIIVAGLVLVFFIELIASVHAAQDDLTSRVAGAVVEWLAFVASANAYLRASGAVQRRVFGAWLAAAVVYMVGNVAFGLVSYRPGHWVDGIWFAAWVCRWVGVRAPMAMAPAPFHEPRPARQPVAYENSVVPYLLLAGGFVLLLWAQREGRGLLLLAIGAGTMTTLLVLRHIAELRENRRLFAVQLEQEARFRSLVQQSSDVVVVLGADGRATYVSPSVSRVFGEDSGVEVGADILGSLVTGQGGGLADVVARRGESGRFAATLRLPSGAREVEVVTSDLRDDPSVAGIVLSCRDVTERNDLERQLHHAQKLEAVGQLAGGLAHEFNNLLAVIRGSAEMLAQDLRDQPVGREHLQRIDQCVDRASALTRQVLAFSRRQVVQAMVLDLDQVLRELKPILRQLMPPGIEVTVTPATGGWCIKADQGQVEQVIVNLVANARDAMPGGGRVEVRTRRHVLPCGPDDRGDPIDGVALDVLDQGTGLTPEVRARMFEPFFTTKPRGEGSGLGLAMVHGIVGRAGGRIEVTSEAGQGATFTVVWPRVDGVVPARVPAVESDAPLGGGRAVLVVDDEPGIRHFVQRALEQRGFQVTTAADGAEALALAGQSARRIDVLLTDLLMPGMSGQQLAARFRELRPAVPIVGMTGYADDSQPAGAAHESMSALLAKPFRVDALLRALDAATSVDGLRRPWARRAGDV
jgi:PAS domain S-box-containing protein